MTRAALPDRRLGETVAYIHDGQKCYGTLGFKDRQHYEQGAEPSEIFLDVGRPGSALNAICRDFAILWSKAVEQGASQDELRSAMTRLDDGSAASAGGKLLDLIAEDK